MLTARQVMRRWIEAAALGGAIAGSTVACSNQEPLADDRANNWVTACCEQTASRAASINDVQSNRFRAACASCRKGTRKGECADGARAVQQAASEAFNQNLMPVECTTLHESLKAVGVDIPAL